MDILPLKYVQITKRGQKVMHFLVRLCRVLGFHHVILRSQHPNKPQIWKNYITSFSFKIGWHICERQSCAIIMINTGRNIENCTVPIQILTKLYFFPYLSLIFICLGYIMVKITKNDYFSDFFLNFHPSQENSEKSP